MQTSPNAQVAPGNVLYPDFSQVTHTSDEGIHPEDIMDWVVSRLAECTGMEPMGIEAHQPCSAYGLDSLSGVTLVGDLELWLNVHLSPTLLWDMPSIDQLVQHLVEASTASPEQAWRAGVNLDSDTARHLLPQLEDLSDQEIDAVWSQLAA